MNSGKLLLVYEPEQVPYVNLTEGETVVALDYEVELDLKKRNIPFVSLVSLAKSPEGNRELIEHTRSLALRWYTDPDMAFFAHDGIKLGEQYEVVVLYYIQTLVYYVSTLSQVLAHFPYVRSVTIPETHVQVPSTADPTAKFKERLPVDVIRLLAQRKDIKVVVLPAPLGTQTLGVLRGVWHAVREQVVRVLAHVLNFIVTALQPRRKLVIFATDPWNRIEPFMKQLPEAELVMSRRRELSAMGLRAAWRTRARFHHRLDFADRGARTLARRGAQEIVHQWEALGEPAVAKNFVHEGTSYWPVAKQVFDAIVCEHAQDAILTIESLKRLFATYGVNRILLFASTKGYNNLIARFAERLNIASIENQHALVNNEKTLVHCRLNSRYLASYGPIINRMYKSWGVEPWRLVSVGSPRFDTYKRKAAPEELSALEQRLVLPERSLRMLYCMQQIYLSLEYGNFTSYEVEQILRDIASLQKDDPSLTLLLRPRPGKWRASYYHREETCGLFPGEKRLVQNEDLRLLFELSDIVITGGSTVILETMLMHKPVVLYVPHVLDNDFKEFWEAGAILMARDRETLAKHVEHLSDPANRAQIVARADSFVAENFIFDGNSYLRMANLLRNPPKP